MTLRVFYSWQSEVPEKINRYLIRGALEDAGKAVQTSLGLDERPQLDHNTKGTPGSPDIVQTIFAKIENCSIFVADVTFTSQAESGRNCPNANVLIELGYAFHALGDARLILVMNDAYGSPNGQMPFNLAHRRWPLTYSLSAGSDNATCKSAREALKADLVNATKVIVESGVLLSTATTSSIVRTDRTLFAEFLELLPSDGEAISFLRNHDLGGAFRDDSVKSIERFIREWNNAQHEFLNAELEEKRKQLVAELSAFITRLNRNTWYLRDTDLRSMRLDDVDVDDERAIEDGLCAMPLTNKQQRRLQCIKIWFDLAGAFSDRREAFTDSHPACQLRQKDGCVLPQDAVPLRSPFGPQACDVPSECDSSDIGRELTVEM